MNIEAEFEEFTHGETRLHFVIGVSGLIMKQLDDSSATVYCWDSEAAAKDFISTKFPEKQRKHYSIRAFNVIEFEKAKQTIKWLPEKAEVNLEMFSSEKPAT